MAQAAAENLEFARKFKEKIAMHISLDKLILFGSRTGKIYHGLSDFDFLVISESFEGIPWHKRAIKLYLQWAEDYPIELLCYTPKEFEAKKSSGIVKEVSITGLAI